MKSKVFSALLRVQDRKKDERDLLVSTWAALGYYTHRMPHISSAQQKDVETEWDFIKQT